MITTEFMLDSIMAGYQAKFFTKDQAFNQLYRYWKQSQLKDMQELKAKIESKLTEES